MSLGICPMIWFIGVPRLPFTLDSQSLAEACPASGPEGRGFIEVEREWGPDGRHESVLKATTTVTADGTCVFVVDGDVLEPQEISECQRPFNFPPPAVIEKSPTPW